VLLNSRNEAQELDHSEHTQNRNTKTVVRTDLLTPFYSGSLISNSIGSPSPAGGSQWIGSL